MNTNKKYNRYDIEYFNEIDMHDVLDAFNIKLNRNGNFHCINKEGHKRGDKNPSAGIYAPKDGSSALKTRWGCFTCQCGGNAINFVERYMGYNFGQALDWLYNNGFVDPHALISQEIIEQNKFPVVPKEMAKNIGMDSYMINPINDEDYLEQAKQAMNKINIFLDKISNCCKRLIFRYPEIPKSKFLELCGKMEAPYIDLWGEFEETYNKKIDEIYGEGHEELYVEDEEIKNNLSVLLKNDLEEIENLFTPEENKKIEELQEKYKYNNFKLPPLPDNILKEANISILLFNASDKETILKNAHIIKDKLTDYRKSISDDYKTMLKFFDFGLDEKQYLENKTKNIILIISKYKNIYRNICKTEYNKMLETIEEKENVFPWDEEKLPSMPWEKGDEYDSR